VRTHFADALDDDRLGALGEIMDALARHLGSSEVGPGTRAPDPDLRARPGRGRVGP
jgi:hypothetical protein